MGPNYLMEILPLEVILTQILNAVNILLAIWNLP